MLIFSKGDDRKSPENSSSRNNSPKPEEINGNFINEFSGNISHHF